jgi:hypothetical protein
MPLNLFNKIKKQFNVRPANVTLQSFQGKKVKPVGIVNVRCKFKDKEAYINFMAVEYDTPVRLGVFGCIALNLIKTVNNFLLRTV